MERQSFFIFLTAWVLLAMSPVQASLKPNVMVSEFQIKEGSAIVGKDFTLSLTLTNIEPATCANTVTTSLQASFPFILKGVTAIKAGDLCEGKIAVVDFPMKVDPTAVGGSYQLTVTNNFETTTLAQYTSMNTINIFVSGSPEINAYIVGSDPIDVYAGDLATISIEVQNDGTFMAQSVNARISAEKPLEAKWSKSFDSLGLLEAKQGKTAQFAIEVPKDVKANDYKISLEVQYLDENLVRSAKNFVFTFHVKEKALFETTDAGSDSLYANENRKTVRLNLENTGTDTARKIKAKVLPQFPFSTDGSVRYIDILEPGKNAPVEFVVNIDKDGTSGAYALDMLLDFEDSQGNRLQETAKVSMAVKTKRFFRAVFLDYWFIWIAILIVAAIVTRRKIRRKKKDK